MAKAKQGNAQGKRTRIRSPRSGAEVACGKGSPGAFKKGQSGNPDGSSAKQRILSALADLVDPAEARELVGGLLKDSKQRKSGGLRFKNRELLLKAAGVLRDEAKTDVNVVLVRKLVFEDRADGDEARPERRQPKPESGAQPTPEAPAGDDGGDMELER